MPPLPPPRRFAINELGRTQQLPPPEDEEAEAPEPVEAGPPPPRELGEGEWAFRVAPGGCVVAKSLKWPGAVAVGKPADKKYVSCYFGFGVPRSSAPYSPPLPPPVQAEWVPGEEGTPLSAAADVLVEPPKPTEEEE